MCRTFLFILFFTGSLLTAYAQVTVHIAPSTRLPKDSIRTHKLLHSFEAFLSLKEKPNRENSYISPSHLLATSALLDELKHIEKSRRFEQDAFYHCYVNNIILIDATTYLLQFSYVGTHKETPVLRAVFSLLAEEQPDRFYFYSPLVSNTALWKTKKHESYTYHYQNEAVLEEAMAYTAQAKAYDQILNSDTQTPTTLYCAKNFNEVLRLMGIDYKADYNGYRYNTVTATENGHHLVIDGYLAATDRSFDPHDLWHSRARRVFPADRIHKAVDEGCAFLFGGSWGYSWEEILQKFKTFIAITPNPDWLALYKEGRDFGDETKKPLRVDYMINALLVQKIKKEEGFPAVVPLLNCGKKKEAYFPALKKATGITKKNFNTRISALIAPIQ
ncbi:hypothetical protein ACFSTE_09195 [Aquimarina hainanensis]|uniref:Uncharacterized protein n=1 Tax=Aquimarina hainanensis TaxID=1578017 RepID=A0ABW5N5U7_9FLAO